MTDDRFSRPGQSAPSGPTSDFSPIAARYDATRYMPERCLSTCYDRLEEQGLFPAEGVILDAGCGTGQVSLPLATRGYEVRGIDISAEMISLARSKVRPGWRARYTVGDVRKITDADGTFDAIVVSKLFQHVQDWREACRELIRVARPGSFIVQVNERGAFGNSVRRYFSRRADELGFDGRFIGLNPHSGEELAAHMKDLGCDAAPVDMSDLQWEIRIGHGEALRRIQERLFAEFWYLPADVHDKIAADTIAWVESQENGRDTIERLTPYLVVDVFRTPFSSRS